MVKNFGQINIAYKYRLIEINVLKEVLEVLEQNNASPILIGKVKLALR